MLQTSQLQSHFQLPSAAAIPLASGPYTNAASALATLSSLPTKIITLTTQLKPQFLWLISPAMSTSADLGAFILLTPTTLSPSFHPQRVPLNHTCWATVLQHMGVRRRVWRGVHMYT